MASIDSPEQTIYTDESEYVRNIALRRTFESAAEGNSTIAQLGALLGFVPPNLAGQTYRIKVTIRVINVRDESRQ